MAFPAARAQRDELARVRAGVEERRPQGREHWLLLALRRYADRLDIRGAG
jgi:hypothetical protein